MTVRCSICRLEASKLAAINALLRSGAPLQAIADLTAFSKSALHRHNAHSRDSLALLDPLAAENGALAALREGQSGKNSVGRDFRSYPEDLQAIWEECWEGLADAKSEIVLRKPDGSELTLPGDLRARQGFIREAHRVREALALTLGEVQPTGSNVNVAIKVIALPKAEESPVIEASAQRIDGPDQAAD